MVSNQRNSFFSGLQYLIVILVAFITLKINIGYFGDKTFGMWILFIALWGLGSNVDFGFGLSIVKYVASAYNEKDYKSLNEIISSSCIFFIVMGGVIFALGSIVGFLIYFKNPQLVPRGQYNEAKLVFVLLGINFYIQYFGLFIRSVLEGLNNYVIASKNIIFTNIFLLISTFVVKYLHLSLVHLSMFYCIASSVYLIVITFYLFISYKEIKVKFTFFNIKKIFSLFKFSLKIQLTFISLALFDPLIKYLLGTLSSLSLVTYYEIARKISLAISGLFNNIFRTSLTKISTLKSESEYEGYILTEGKNIYKMSVAYSCLFYGIGSFIFAAIIKLWFGFDEAILLFLLLTLPESISNYGFFSFMFLVGVGKAGLLSIFTLLNLIIVGLGVYVSFTISNSPLGLFSYYITTLIINILIFRYLSIKKYVKILELFKVTNSGSLIILDAAIILSILCVYFKVANTFYILGVLSAASAFIFRKDFTFYFKYFSNLVFKRYAR